VGTTAGVMAFCKQAEVIDPAVHQIRSCQEYVVVNIFLTKALTHVVKARPQVVAELTSATVSQSLGGFQQLHLLTCHFTAGIFDLLTDQGSKARPHLRSGSVMVP
jgi:hypothetical protein